MKYKRARVEIAVSADGRMKHLRWNSRRVDIKQQVNTWVIQGYWWREEIRREYVQLHTSGGMVEIYREEGIWWLSRMLD